MTRRGFRFHPPESPPGPEVAWVLAWAFGPASPLPPPAGPDAALALAARLALLPRIAARADLEAAARRLGEPAAERLRRERALGAAREMRLDETLHEAASAAAELGVEIALLKGRALAMAGHSPTGARPSTDVDLLVPPEAVEPLRAALRRRGFVEQGAGREHHVPTLHRPGLSNVELHRYLPGVRLAGAASARWRELERAGLLASPSAGRSLPGLRLPVRELLIAHALVHGLAQHGLHGAAYPGWLLIADLVDLEAAEPPTAAAGTAVWRRWIARDVSARETDSALELARVVAAGGDPLPSPGEGDSARLARHLLACALDADYRDSLKARWLEAPLSDRPLWIARLVLLARSLVPRHRDPDDPPAQERRTAWAWPARARDLAAGAARALRARRRLRARERRTQEPGSR